MKKIFTLLCGFTYALCALAFDGAGTASDPYRLASEADLQALRTGVNDDYNTFEGTYFQLANDIELSAPWTPIGNSFATFKGIFDGQNHGVEQLMIDATDQYVGFFAQLNGAVVKNFRILSGVIVGDSIVGGIAGYSSNSIISNCGSAAAVSGKYHVGGITGKSSGDSIVLSFNMGRIVSDYTTRAGEQDVYGVGGITGVGIQTVMQSCYNAGEVRCNDNKFYAGGLCGDFEDGATMQWCYNIGCIAGNGQNGALIGLLQDESDNPQGTRIDSCYNDRQLVTTALFGRKNAINSNGVESVTCTYTDNCSTSELTNRPKWGLFVANSSADRYSCGYSAPESDPFVWVSVAAIAKLSDDETVDGVNSDFALGAPDVSTKNLKISINANQAKVNCCKNGQECDTLTFSRGGYSRSIAMRINNTCDVYHESDARFLCESELATTIFGDTAHTTFKMSDFVIEKDYAIDTTLVYVSACGCDSIVSHRLTCYPAPKAQRSSDIARQNKVIAGNSFAVKFELSGFYSNFSFETSDGVSGDSSNKYYTRTLTNLTTDTEFYFSSLSGTVDGHTCDALAGAVSDTVFIAVADHVDITLTVKEIGNGTLEDAAPTVIADGHNAKSYLIAPADGYYLAKFEAGLDEYALADVTFDNGNLRYTFTPTTDTELIATFAPVEAWDGTTLTAPIEGNDTIVIFTPEELAWVADQTNTWNNDFDGKTLIIKNNIDLNGHTFDAIGTGTPFAGTFEAQCKTIANGPDANAPYGGLFGQVTGIVNGFPLVPGRIEAIDTTICANEAIRFGSAIPAVGGTNSTYLWKCNGEIVANSANEEFVWEGEKAAGEYLFTRWSTNDCVASELQAEGSSKVTVREPFTSGEIAANDTSVYTCYQPITITSLAPANGDDNTLIIWKENGIEIDDATAAEYTIPAGKPVGTYHFTRWAKNDTYCASEFSQSAGTFTLTIAEDVHVTTVNVNAEGCTFVSDDGTDDAKTSASKQYNITLVDGFYLQSIESRAQGSLLDSVYIDHGQLRLTFTPSQPDELTATFAPIPTWDGTARRPFMTRTHTTAATIAGKHRAPAINNDSIYIFTPNDLAWLATAGHTFDDTIVMLQNNLNLGGSIDWTPIATFDGEFNGRNHEIKGLYHSNIASDHVGLFGQIGTDAEVHHFAVTGGTLQAREYVGSIAAVNRGHVHHIYNMCEIKEYTQYAGGLVGANSGHIHHAYNVGIIYNEGKNGKCAGGIVGYNQLGGRIDSVYNAANVASKAPYGSIVAQNDGALSHVYFDQQMCVGRVVGDGEGPITMPNGTASGKLTSAMYGIFAGDDNWITTATLYPQLRDLAGSYASNASVAPVMLVEQSAELNNSYNSVESVTEAFRVNVENGSKWHASDIVWVKIDNDYADVIRRCQEVSTVQLIDSVGDDRKIVQIRMPELHSFLAGEIKTDSVSICFGEYLTIPQMEPASGGDGINTYGWICEYLEDDMLRCDTINNFEQPNNDTEWAAINDKVGTFTYTRIAHDGTCQNTFILSEGQFKVTVLPKFDAGSIVNRSDTICQVAGTTPVVARIDNEELASGGDGDITYRWTIAVLGSKHYDPIAGSESPSNSSYTPDLSDLSPGSYTIMRQAKDEKCADDWITSEGCDTITLFGLFDAGSLDAPNDTLCLDGNAATLVVEEQTAAQGGDGAIAYKWEIVICDKNRNLVDMKTIDNQGETLQYDITHEGEFPIYCTISRYAHDGRCSTDWQKSANDITLTLAQTASRTITMYVCENDFPYVYTYTYNNNPARATEKLIFDLNDAPVTLNDYTNFGCDYPVTIDIQSTPVPEAEIANQQLMICETDAMNNFQFEVQPLKGTPTSYSITFDDAAHTNGFVDVPYTTMPSNKIIQIARPATAQPNIYNAALRLMGGTISCESEPIALQIIISLDGYLHQKWNDVIVVNNSGSNGQLTFDKYQWYRNDVAVEGATQQHIYEESHFKAGDVYYAILTTSDGRQLRTCDFVPTATSNAPRNTIAVYPVPARNDETITVAVSFEPELLANSTLAIYNAQGVRIYATNHVSEHTTLPLGLGQGAYLVRLIDSNGDEHTTKFIIQ